MLDEFCANTHYHRKHALRLLNGPPPGRARPRPGSSGAGRAHQCRARRTERTSRKLMGWERYDTAPAVEAMNDLYRHELRLGMNVFQPSVKLVLKVRVRARLRVEQESLDPFELNRRIEDKLGALYELAHRRLSPSQAPLPRRLPTHRGR